MSLDLETAAHICQIAGRNAVTECMVGRGRYSPWETREVQLNISILQALVRSQGSDGERDRVIDEMRLGSMTNVRYKPLDVVHPVDLVVLHPLIGGLDGSCYPWGHENMQVRGLIEIKKHLGMIWEAEVLNSVEQSLTLNIQPDWQRPADWALIVILLVRGSEAGIHQDHNSAETALKPHSFLSLVPCQPIRAPLMKGDDITEKWFEIVCFGKQIPNS